MIMTLTNTGETHDLKLKPSYKASSPASGCALHSDTSTYPILKSVNESFHRNKLRTNLSGINLK